MLLTNIVVRLFLPLTNRDAVARKNCLELQLLSGSSGYLGPVATKGPVATMATVGPVATEGLFKTSQSLAPLSLAGLFKQQLPPTRRTLSPPLSAFTFPSMQNNVPATQDVVPGDAGEGDTLSPLCLQDFAWSALSDGTALQYKSAWKKFYRYGSAFNVDINKFEFDFQFICEYFLFKLHMTNSVASVLSSRSALTFSWNLYSSQPCPLQHKLVSTFLSGMQRKYKNFLERLTLSCTRRFLSSSNTPWLVSLLRTFSEFSNEFHPIPFELK